MSRYISLLYIYIYKVNKYTVQQHVELYTAIVMRNITQ